jgi:hypothetical protein
VTFLSNLVSVKPHESSHSNIPSPGIFTCVQSLQRKMSFMKMMFSPPKWSISFHYRRWAYEMTEAWMIDNWTYSTRLCGIWRPHHKFGRTKITQESGNFWLVFLDCLLGYYVNHSFEGWSADQSGVETHSWVASQWPIFLCRSSLWYYACNTTLAR